MRRPGPPWGIVISIGITAALLFASGCTGGVVTLQGPANPDGGMSDSLLADGLPSNVDSAPEGLVVEEVWAEPALPQQEDKVVLFARIRNRSNAQTAAAVSARFSVDGMQVGTGQGVESTLGAGAVVTLRMSESWTAASAGTHTLRAATDDHALEKPLNVLDRFLFGLLMTDRARSTGDFAYGVRVAHLPLSWERYEPAEGQFSESYLNEVKATLAALRSQGYAVSLGHEIHVTPAWVSNLSGGRYVNQYGVSSEGPNLVFSQTVRDKAEAYYRRVAQDLGTDFYSVRVELGIDAGEILYPPSNDGAGHDDSIWGFDENAQGTGSDRPAETAPCPFPGWKPGDTTYNGQPFTQAKAIEWYDWYVRSMVKAGDWQVRIWKQLGHRSKMAWLIPGSGMRPFDVARFTSNRLKPDPMSSAASFDAAVGGRAAVWHWVIDLIADKEAAQIQITSVADQSGNPRGNDCLAADKQVALDNQGEISVWSDTRWIAYNADRWLLPKSGENPGPHDSRATMDMAARLTKSCGLQAWFYAFHFSLYDGFTGAATSADYAQVIASY